jgi:hypothetical protein
VDEMISRSGEQAALPRADSHATSTGPLYERNRQGPQAVKETKHDGNDLF